MSTNEIPYSCRPVGDHEFDTYDWEAVFQYAGEGNQRECPYLAVPPTHPNKDTPQPGFRRSDVEIVIRIEEGDNDGPDWICVGRLKDGRFFVVSAGCDYTGWG